MDRRNFLRNLGFITGAGAVSLSIGNIPVRAFAQSFLSAKAENGSVLVLIQLSGGNDGLNTVIPYEDSLYYNARPSIGIRKSEVLPLNSLTGLHSSLMPFKEIYDKGKLTVVQNVGYPNPDRSHFRSTDIWLTASDSDEYVKDGWVGRFLANAFPDYDNFNKNHPMAIQLGSTQSTLLECTCQGSMGLTFEDPNQFYRLINGAVADNDPPPDTLAGDQLRFIKEIASQSIQYATIIKEKADTIKNIADYPNSGLARQLSIVAQLIAGGLETPVYLTSMGGFDTHSGQVNSHADLLSDLSGAVGAFQKDLELLGAAERVVIMTFSEFGRRVEQNGSNGTDHGTAAPVFVIGQNVNGGIIGENPDLADLDNNGDIKFQYDFRQIYSSLLVDHLNMSADKLPGVLFKEQKELPNLPLINVKGLSSGGPKSFQLNQNYPNPFNPRTRIDYILYKPQFITLKVYNPNGEEVRTLANGYKQAGSYTVYLDGGSLASGTYYARLVSGSYRKTIKMVLLK